MVTRSEELIPIPYPFKHKEKRAILVFAASKELQELSVESGADIALGADAVKKVAFSF